MPELPDITAYCEAIQERFVGVRLTGTRVASPFVLRTYAPPLEALKGTFLRRVSRIGKRVVLHFDDDLCAVIHLMVAGRLKPLDKETKLPKKLGLLAFDFETESLLLTEAGTKKRASVHLFSSAQEAQTLDRGGIDVFSASFSEFRDRVRCENRTLKRALTDPRLLSGIGNAYSDEILFWAELSPVKLTGRLTEHEIERLFVATRHTLRAWSTLLRKERAGGFLEKVTAFRPEMAVHGKYKSPCRQCGSTIQRIVYASNETNYCPRCQTGGQLLRDRGLSRLLRKDWPKNIDELEELSASSRGEGRRPPAPNSPGRVDRKGLGD